MLKMDNVWILTNINDWEKPVAEYFKREGLWDKVIVNRMDFFNEKLKLKVIPIELYNTIYSFLPQFMDMFSRNSSINQNTYVEYNIHDYTNLFNIYVNYYYTLYNQEKISLYITNRAPHVGIDLVAYMVARTMGIKTLILEQSLFQNRFFIYTEHEDYGLFRGSKNIMSFEPLILVKKFEKDLFYMKKAKLSPFQLLRKFYVENKIIRLCSELLHKRHRGQAFYRYKLKTEFDKNKNMYIRSVNLQEKYIYFALHLQPEKTTSSWGGKYVDQMLAVEQLSQVIPSGIRIYLKENPKQNFFMRGPFFYERLRRLENVTLVPSDVDTYQLIKNSLFVATITGTVGWEAITGGKNVLIFGWGVWYKNFPGVFSFDNGFDFNDAVFYQINEEELEKKVNELLRKTGKGVIYTKGNGYKSIVRILLLKKMLKILVFQ